MIVSGFDMTGLVGIDMSKCIEVVESQAVNLFVLNVLLSSGHKQVTGLRDEKSTFFLEFRLIRLFQ